MRSLASLQERFQHGLLSDDDRVLSDIVDSPRETRGVLFEVYRNAYCARLVEIVQHDYEQLSAWLGDAAFEVMARSYVASNPSHYPNARWYSQALPAFLRTEQPWSDAIELSDLAELEQALNNAFDAADGPALQLEALAKIPPASWSELRFRVHPSAARIELRTNATAIWTALRDQLEPPAAARSAAPVHVLVWRQDLAAKFRQITEEEAMVWDEAAAGVPFGVLCEMLSFRGDANSAPLRAATLLQGWIACGLVSDVSWPR